MIQVLCDENKKDDLIFCILSETSSLGVRYYTARRRLLQREQVFIQSEYGEVQVKRVIEPGGGVRLVPEYDVCKKIAMEKNIPLRVVYDTIVKSS